MNSTTRRLRFLKQLTAIEQHLNGQTPPLQLWKEERAKLLTERAALNARYSALKEEVGKAEIVKRNVERLMSRSE